MDMEKVLVKTWISGKMRQEAYYWTLGAVILIQFLSFWYWSQIDIEKWFLLTRESIDKAEYWKLWTSLFLHQDLGHFLSNLVLFVPFSLLLNGYFGFWVFPFGALFISGLMNYMVIMTMPLKTGLLGISGTVYMMAAVWLVLNFFIERHDGFFKRFLKITGIAIALLFPTSFVENVSYLSHGLGFLMGVGFGVLVFYLNRQKFRKNEVYRYTYFYDDASSDYEFPLDSLTKH